MSAAGTTGPLPARWGQEQRIVEALRRLLDREDAEDPSIEEISREVGINKAIIYRHVASKEELLLLALCSYQQELLTLFTEVDADLDPLPQLEQLAERYVAFCLRYPAYLDCVTGLLRRPYRRMKERVSPAVLMRVTQLIAPVNSRFTRVLRAGAEQGVFTLLGDADYVTHMVYSSCAGAMQMVRFGVGIRENTGAFPDVFRMEHERAVRTALNMMLASVGVPPRLVTEPRFTLQ
jgi:AcrR family transcriptional regulator